MTWSRYALPGMMEDVFNHRRSRSRQMGCIMGLYDRDYIQEGYRSPRRYRQYGGRGLGGLSPAVKWLLIANVAIFVLQGLGANLFLTQWFAVWPDSWVTCLQVWRLISYQFLHGGLLHILFNMIGLVSFGPLLEQSWGTLTFLVFYLGCGLVGGLTYIILACLGILSVGFMIGASGAVLGTLAACAILFPQITVMIYLLFPMPIRYVALILMGIGLFVIFTSGPNAGGEAAHIGGMAAGAALVYLHGPITGWLTRFDSYLGRRQASRLADLERQVDAILQKVHDHGIHSLTWRERSILRRATELEKRRAGTH